MTKEEGKQPRERVSMRKVPPDESLIHPPVPQPGGLISPVASDEALIESFRRYQDLKEKLLDESDYTWFCVYKITDKVKREGFQKRAEAEARVKAFRDKNIPADLEKKIKKSGCYKLSKAFGISTTVVEKQLDREQGSAYYLVRAEAPNGQTRERGGSCDRKEKGRDAGPFDHIDSIALTRAEDRAIMALLGGENTAEEFVDEPLVVPDAPVQAQPHQATATVLSDAALAAEVQRAVEASRAGPGPLPPQAQAKVDAISEKFAGTAPAKPVDKQQLLGRMFAAIERAGLDAENVKREVKRVYGIGSSSEMTVEQILEVTGYIESKKEGDPL